MWSNTDPRESIDKRANIIILRPSLIGVSHPEVAYAQVDTKEVYCIFTDFENYRCINADMKWDPSWQWEFAPDL
jgi:hypothetical protein